MKNADRTSKRATARLLAGAVLSGVTLCSVASAALVTWTGAAGDSFNDSTKWSAGAVPGIATLDVGVFNNNVNGNVNFTSGANPAGLSFRNTSGAITMALGGNTLTMGSAANTGTILLGSAAGQVNDVTFTGGSLVHTHASGAMLTVGFSGSNGNKATFSGSTMLSTGISTGGAFATIGVANSNNNQLIVQNQATADWRGTVNVGVINAAPASASTGNVLTVNNGTFNLAGGSRGLNLRNGTLNLTDAYSDLGFLDVDDAGNTTTVNFNSGKLYSRRTQIDNGKNFVIGDGGATSATFGTAYSTGTLTIGATAGNADLVINSNGILSGGGAGTITINGTGTLRGVAGAKVSPYIIGQPSLLTDDRATGTINLTGKWDNTNLELLMDVGDFPAGAANVPAFTPLDFINVTGSFTHGGTVTFNVGGYVAPPSAAEYKVVSWASEIGLSSSTLVQFTGGGALPYRFDNTGLYLTVPEPASATLIALSAMLFGRRRRD